MSIRNAAKRAVRPTHPGEMLWQDFMPDYDLTVSTLAEARFFAAAGFRDLTYAFPIPLSRIEEETGMKERLWVAVLATTLLAPSAALAALLSIRLQMFTLKIFVLFSGKHAVSGQLCVAVLKL